jgi:hypothetical protein
VRGRYDASYGLMLRGDGAGHLQALDLALTDIVIQGQVRDMQLLRRADGKRWVVIARNDDTLQFLGPLR